MRTKKNIRKGEKFRTILGFVLMMVAIVMLIVGYLAHEYNFTIVKVLQDNATSKTILVVITIIWFAVALILFVAGLLIIYFRAIRHHEYVERPYSSKVE